MSKFSRYLFVKKNYPDFVVFIRSKERLITYNKDLEIVNLVSYKKFFDMNINYIVVCDLNIFVKEFDCNNYFYYFKITLIKSIIDYVNDRRKICLRK